MTRIARAAPSFAQVEMMPAPQQPEAPDATPEQPTASSEPAVPLRPEGLIEIVLPSGVTLRVDAAVEADALRRVLGRGGGPMIALPPGVRVYLACGMTDMRKGMVGLAMLVQQGLVRRSVRRRALRLPWPPRRADQAALA